LWRAADLIAARKRARIQNNHDKPLLVGWQSAPSNPASTANFAYDGEGNRVAQNANGTTTLHVGGGKSRPAAR
jgi:hypothetical protein